jgi:Rad3-related DNA helicase
MDFGQRLAEFGSRRYQQLRPSQVRVLAGYVDHIDDQDVAIELPTGFGKTLVALLIADLAMERGDTVAYLTGTNQLADQVLAQARDLPAP